VFFYEKKGKKHLIALKIVVENKNVKTRFFSKKNNISNVHNGYVTKAWLT